MKAVTGPPGQRGQRVKGFLSQQLRVVVSLQPRVQLPLHQLGDLPFPSGFQKGPLPDFHKVMEVIWSDINSQSSGKPLKPVHRTVQC